MHANNVSDFEYGHGFTQQLLITTEGDNYLCCLGKQGRDILEDQFRISVASNKLSLAQPPSRNQLYMWLDNHL
jgi:hypothetical protein